MYVLAFVFKLIDVWRGKYGVYDCYEVDERTAAVDFAVMYGQASMVCVCMYTHAHRPTRVYVHTSTHVCMYTHAHRPTHSILSCPTVCIHV